MARKRPGYPYLSKDLVNLMMKHLRRKKPDITEEETIKILEMLQERFREMNIKDPEGLIKLYDELIDDKLMKTN